MHLVPYTASFESAMLPRIAAFFGFHHALMEQAPVESHPVMPDDGTRQTLAEWLALPNRLFVITEDDVPVGFIRINHRGPNVAWIEDVFVDEAHRGKGIASAAIAAVEGIVRNTPGCTAVCMDVSPHNVHAMRLYHKLGYTDLSLITLRKELADSKRNNDIDLLGMTFKY